MLWEDCCCITVLVETDILLVTSHKDALEQQIRRLLRQFRNLKGLFSISFLVLFLGMLDVIERSLVDTLLVSLVFLFMRRFFYPWILRRVCDGCQEPRTMEEPDVI